MGFIKKVEGRIKEISASLLVSPYDWDLPRLLDNEMENNKLYLKFKKSPRITTLHSWTGRDLVERGQHVVLLNHTKQSIEYYVQYEFGKFRGIKTITQIALWAHKEFPLPNIEGLSAIKWTFFKYLLPKAQAISADSIQTEAGKTFWLKRLQDACDSDYMAYVVLRDQNAVIALKEGTDIEAVDKYVWGYEKHHEYRKAFISDKNIFPDAVSVTDYLKSIQK